MPVPPALSRPLLEGALISAEVWRRFRFDDSALKLPSIQRHGDQARRAGPHGGTRRGWPVGGQAPLGDCQGEFIHRITLLVRYIS